MSTDVVRYGQSDWLDLSFDELLAEGVIDIAEIDDVVIVEKTDLIGRPFILVDFTFQSAERSSYARPYAVVRVKRQTGDGSTETAVFADGGAGIIDQLSRYRTSMEKRQIPFSPLYFHYGLRASEYTAEVPVLDKSGNPTGDMAKIPATTYYFDNRRRP